MGNNCSFMIGADYKQLGVPTSEMLKLFELSPNVFSTVSEAELTLFVHECFFKLKQKNQLEIINHTTI